MILSEHHQTSLRGEDEHIDSILADLDELPLSMAELEDFSLSRDKANAQVNFIASMIKKEERQKWKGQKRLELNPELYRLLSSELPIDVAFEIFGHLHPIDLFHLAYTSKSLRSLVMTQNAGHWRMAFLRHSELPSCPPQLPEPKWAALLFGPASCDDCDSKVALLDFALLRRSCSDCMKRNNVYRVVVHRADNTAWDLIPYTLRTQASRFCDSAWTLDAKYFRKYVYRDFLKMASKLEDLQDAVDCGNPGALEALETFRRLTSDDRAARIQHANTCNSWAEGFQVQWDRNIDGEVQESVARLVKRCVSQGHDERDVIACLQRNNVHHSFKESRPKRRVSRDMSLLFREEFEKEKEERMVREYEGDVKHRKDLIKELYEKYREELTPEERAYSPAPHSILEMGKFPVLIDAPTGAHHDHADYLDAIAELQILIPEWRERERQELFHMVPKSHHLNKELPASTTIVLALATSIFMCCGCGDRNTEAIECLIGWDTAKTHVGCPHLEFSPSRRLSFSNGGAQTVASLTRLLGVDSLEASAADLDQLDARFVCGNCLITGSRGQGYKVLTWRECVTHAIQKDFDKFHPSNSWRLLTPEATAIARPRERALLSSADKTWTCSHCSAFFSKRRGVLDHVKTSHSMTHPTRGVDISYCFRSQGRNTPCQRFIISVNHPQEFKCKHCPDTVRNIFSMRGLIPHLRKKHRVENPTMNEDWVKFQLFLEIPS